MIAQDAAAPDTLTDRIAGALLGVHCGDSLGATAEFAGENRSRRVTEIVGGGTFRWAPGDPTDDTDLTAAILRATLAVGPDAPVADVVDAAASRFVDWLNGRPRDIGGTTRTALVKLREGAAPSASGATHDSSAANGSLMRCIPTAVARRDAARRAAETRALSAITHAEARCLDACAAYNDLVAALVFDRTDPADAVYAVAENATGPVRDLLRDAIATRGSRPQPFDPRGYVLHSLDVAVWALLDGRPADEVLIEVASIGGDADTNGAIAGGLLYARDGAAAIPAQWRATIKLGDEFAAAAETIAGWHTA